MKRFLAPLISLAVLVFVCGFVYALSNNLIVVGYNKDYAPTQPLPFSHAQHAGEFQIDCTYCHTSTRVSRHASVPSLNICMNCHSLVKLDSPALTLLKEHYAENRPIQWQKVHLLPDHVKFNHGAHVRAGKDCTQCHGTVQEMKVMKQVESLSMGWCVNCHRQPENKAPITCGTCHY